MQFTIQVTRKPDSAIRISGTNWGFRKNSPKGKPAAALGDEGQCQLRHTISDAKKSLLKKCCRPSSQVSDTLPLRQRASIFSFAV